MRARAALFLPGVLLLAIVLALSWISPFSPDVLAPGSSSGARPFAVRTPSADLDRALAQFVADRATGAPTAPVDHPVLAGPAGPAYVALRSHGARLAEAWGTGAGRAEALETAIDLASGMLSGDEGEVVDAIEVSIGSPVETLEGPEERRRLSNANRGVLGLEVLVPERGVVRFAPSQMIARNLSFNGALDDAAATLGVPREVLDVDAEIGVFAAEQLLVDTRSAALTWMFRGNQVVQPGAVTARSVADLAASMEDWLLRNVHADGRMTYAYWPSRGEESTANNSIRQWMASIALGRVAAARSDEGIHDLARQNIEHNLGEFYRTDGELGLIVEADGDVKLGAVALAALALIEHPDRADFAIEEAALRRTVDALWRPDGSFRTFYRPEDRNDNQNFYPGEALLLWAVLLREDGDDALGDRFIQSARFYRAWHREQRNPAFVPWHTQAYVIAWRETRNAELRDFVFEMNDWLLGLQQWEEAEYADLRGRFYDPRHPEYGQPHASSDGVYLEGLAAAHQLAIEADDHVRADRYRAAINRAMRNLMQLHFADEVDLYYVSDPDPVAGGVRTTPYDNEIRVDNVQHNLMGVLHVLATFQGEDYSDP